MGSSSQKKKITFAFEESSASSSVDSSELSDIIDKSDLRKNLVPKRRMSMSANKKSNLFAKDFGFKKSATLFTKQSSESKGSSLLSF